MEEKSFEHWTATAVPSLDGSRTTLIVEGRVKMGILPAEFTLCRHDVGKSENQIGFDLSRWGNGIFHPVSKKVDVTERPELNYVVIYDKDHNHRIVAEVSINRDVHSFASDPDTSHEGGVISGG